jgi:asparagine synthase (glutamine-hydrolysing)
MCGVAGFFQFGGGNEAAMIANARAMTDAVAYRGPDDFGIWVDAASGIALGHRRLSIVDLSPAGHQPMTSSDGRFVISYNGEIYNWAAIRRELEEAGHEISWRGHSDTEVLLEACVRWGIDDAIRRLAGMFTIALWDRQTRSLTLVRDRLGIKPLYWAMFGSSLVFGSELKALRRYPLWRGAIDRNALTSYLRFGYVPAPHSIHQGVHKLLPGQKLTCEDGGEPRLSTYWSVEDVAREGMRHRIDVSPAGATDRLETLLRETIGSHMMADVPLGAFLSGGVDSSTVVALMQAQSARPVRTFSIGFKADGYDEAQHAAAVARHLGTDHTEFYLEPHHARDVIPRLPEMFDEPFADSSEIPTFLVSQLTRKHVTVALSGDGGDELFAGYNRYIVADRLWKRLAYLPQPLRRGVAGAIHLASPQAWDRLLAHLPRRLTRPQAGDKLYKLARIASASPAQLYPLLVSLWDNSPDLVIGGAELPDLVADSSAENIAPDLAERMQYLDQRTYLPDDILTKVDRASMAVGLEARVPLLDHRVVEFAWSLPRDLKLRGGSTKWLLRQVLYRHVPTSLIERPKMGFGAPVESWLRGPLREWAETLLGEQRLNREGYLNAAPIRRRLTEHMSGARNWQHSLWAALMFQSWLEHQAH